MVVSELRGEKIDIIPFNDEPARFVAKALSPARVREVLVDDDNKQATVVVPDDQLSLAIGKEGQNARLAARLTGWRVDIKSETEFAEEEAELGLEPEEDVTGRCHAVLSTGKRCPNAALPGSRYCGLPAHQALAEPGGPSRPPASPSRRSPPPTSAAAEERRGRGARRRGARGRGAGRRGAAAEEPVAEEPAAEEPAADGAPSSPSRPRRRGAGREAEERAAEAARSVPMAKKRVYEIAKEKGRLQQGPARRAAGCRRRRQGGRLDGRRGRRRSACSPAADRRTARRPSAKAAAERRRAPRSRRSQRRAAADAAARADRRPPQPPADARRASGQARPPQGGAGARAAPAPAPGARWPARESAAPGSAAAAGAAS